MRWCTPKRCCSSTTASARSANSTSSCTSACVPTTSWIEPSARPCSVSFFWLLAVAAGQQRQAHAGRFGERRDGGVMLARQQLGRRHERRLRAGLDADQHGEEGDQRLAAADIALQQPDHALGLGHVGLDLAGREDLAGRQLERQRRQRALLQAAVALGRRGRRALRL